MVHLCKTYTTRKGISLVETLVAVALFSIVMMVAVGALVSLIDANRKARSEKTVVNNISVSLEQMVREIREGTGHTIEYGGSKIKFYTREGVLMEYYLKTDNRIYRRKGEGAETPLTASGVYVGDLTFYTANVGGDEPAIQIFMRGRSGNSADTQSDFRLQTTVAGRSREVQAIVTIAVPTSAGTVETGTSPISGGTSGGTDAGPQQTDSIQLGSTYAKNNECHSPLIVGIQPLSRITFDTDPFGDYPAGEAVYGRNGARYTSDGNWCGAVSLDGYNDFVEYEDASRFRNMHSGLTIAAWIYPKSWGSGASRKDDCDLGWNGNDCQSACIVATDNIGLANGWSFFINPNGSLGFNVDNGQWNPPWKISARGTIKLNEWQHVAFSWSDGDTGGRGLDTPQQEDDSIQLYINGEWTRLEGTGYNSGVNVVSDDSGNPIAIGACRGLEYDYDENEGPVYFDGMIDDVRIYNTVLSQEQVEDVTRGEEIFTDTCPASKPKQCGNYCIPDGAECCDTGGNYCAMGSSCTTGGRCTTGGTTSSGPVCPSGQKLVEDNKYCIPQTAVYCGSGGKYCPSGSCPAAGDACVGPTGSIIRQQGIPVTGYDI